MIAVALVNVAHAYGMARLAKESGLAREGLYEALSPEGNPSFGTVVKGVKALGLKPRGGVKGAEAALRNKV